MWLHVILACAAQLLPGVLLCHLLVPADIPARTAIVTGYGILFGFLASALSIVAINLLGIPLGIAWLIPAQFILCLGIALALGRFTKSAEPRPPAAKRAPHSTLSKVIAGLMLALITAHLLLSTAGATSRPMYPWDTSGTWATKPKVWLDNRELVPFVAKDRWLEARNPNEFTNHRPGHPNLTPLLHLWTALFLDQWHDTLINAAWPLCLLSMVLIFYGQARASGAGPVPALVFTYFLASLPLVNTHVALAGYADLFLGAMYLGSLLAFYRWTVTGDRWLAVFSVALALACPLTKHEGLFWTCTLFAGLLFHYLPVKRALQSSAALAIVVALLLTVFPPDLEVAGTTLAELQIHYYPGAIDSVLSSFFLHANWHLFAYLLPGLILVSIALSPGRDQSMYPLAACLFAATTLFLLLFTFTSEATKITQFRTLNRVALGLVPTGLFFALLLYTRIMNSQPPTHSRA